MRIVARKPLPRSQFSIFANPFVHIFLKCEFRLSFGKKPHHSAKTSFRANICIFFSKARFYFKSFCTFARKYRLIVVTRAATAGD